MGESAKAVGGLELAKYPPWVVVASRYIGTKEIPGKEHNPVIIRWLVELGAWWRDDETPWCGVALAAWMKESGITPPKNYYRAKSWLEWGDALPRPVYGCVAVFDRQGGGHVGLVVGEDTRKRLMILGGNQRNAVNILPFDRSRCVGYRWPSSQYVVRTDLPLVVSTEESSRDEA